MRTIQSLIYILKNKQRFVLIQYQKILTVPRSWIDPLVAVYSGCDFYPNCEESELSVRC